MRPRFCRLASIRRHLTYANLMASIAVFVALGGGAYAAVHVNGKNIENRTISGKKLKNNTLGGKQINERRLGQVPRAARAQSAATAGSASTATTAGSASTATRANSANTANTATSAIRATTADTATTAVNATNATTADSADDAAALGGDPPAAFLVSCPPATTLFGGVCWDNAPRSAANWIDASVACGNAGGRLPTLSELVAYIDQPGTQAAADHWSSEVVDVVVSTQLVFAFRDESGATEFGTGGSALAYRCVFYRTN
jgi:hypothetical protein